MEWLDFIRWPALGGMIFSHFARAGWLGDGLLDEIALASGFTIPIMALLIAVGAERTRNAEKYLLRVFMVAVISQLPYTLSGIGSCVFNDVWGLAFGLLGIVVSKRFRFVGFLPVLSVWVLPWSFPSLIPVMVLVDWFLLKDRVRLGLVQFAFAFVGGFYGSWEFYFWGLSGVLVLLGPYMSFPRLRGGRFLYYSLYPLHLGLIGVVRGLT